MVLYNLSFEQMNFLPNGRMVFYFPIFDKVEWKQYTNVEQIEK